MHKELENGVFHLCQANTAAILFQGVVARIQHKGALLDALCLTAGFTANTTIQSINTGSEFCRREWLCYIVVGTGHKSGNLIHLLGTGSEHNDTDLLTGSANTATYLETVNIRQHYIQNGNADVRITIQLFQRFHTGSGFDCLVAGTFQVDDNKAADIHFVFQYKNFLHHNSLTTFLPYSSLSG